MQAEQQQAGEDHGHPHGVIIAVIGSAVKRSIGSTIGFHNLGEGPY